LWVTFCFREGAGLCLKILLMHRDRKRGWLLWSSGSKKRERERERDTHTHTHTQRHIRNQTMQEARLAGRLQQELKMLQDPSPGVCVWPSDELNLSQLEARMYTLSLSLYEACACSFFLI
jgi:hypothetical protein